MIKFKQAKIYEEVQDQIIAECDILRDDLVTVTSSYVQGANITDEENFIGVNPKDYTDYVCESTTMQGILDKLFILDHVDTVLGALAFGAFCGFLISTVMLLVLHTLAGVIFGILIAVLSGVALFLSYAMSCKNLWPVQRVLNIFLGATSLNYSLSTDSYESTQKERSARRAGTRRSTITKNEEEFGILKRLFGYEAEKFILTGKTYIRTADDGQRGYVATLSAIDINQVKGSDGRTSKKETELFNGVYAHMQTNETFSRFGVTDIHIKPITKVGRLVQDTLSSVHTLFEDYAFNIEELNDSMKCSLGFSLTKSKEDMKLEAAKIFTPKFEEFLYSLYKRYGAFHMHISEKEITFAADINERDKSTDTLVNMGADLVSDALPIPFLGTAIRMARSYSKPKHRKSKLHWDISGDTRAYQYVVNSLARSDGSSKNWNNFCYGRLLSSVENLFTLKALGYCLHYISSGVYIDENQSEMETWGTEVENYILEPYNEIDEDWDDNIKASHRSAKKAAMDILLGNYKVN